MRAIRTIQTFQGHPVPSRAYMPQRVSSNGHDAALDPTSLSASGLPYSTISRIVLDASVYEEAAVVYDYDQALPDDGSDYPKGATVQNNFEPPIWLRCYDCHARVREDETEDHECDDE